MAGGHAPARPDPRDRQIIYPPKRLPYRLFPSNSVGSRKLERNPTWTEVTTEYRRSASPAEGQYIAKYPGPV